jgi:hypothetical protein
VNTREASPTVLEAENNLSESRGSLGAEDLAGADLADAVGERELQVLGDQLADVRALDVLALLDLDDAENVDRPETGAVASSHVGVQSLDGVGAAQLAVLLVHVVGTGARVVADPDAEVLDLLGVLLVQRLDADNLTGSLLDLSETAQEVPETGLGDGLVGREDGHAVQGRRGVSLCGQMAPDDLEFLKTT